MSNLANGKVIIKSTKSLLVQKSSFPLYSNFILNLYIVYELNHWPHNPTNTFKVKNCLFDIDKLTRNAYKSKFIIMVKE